MGEPVLSADDIEVWNRWRRTASIHGRTLAHRRRVDAAIRLIEQVASEVPNAAVSWSGGKDSTVMTHMACVRVGAPMTVLCEKDDLDFPGEEDYVRRIASAWGLRLRMIRPEVSPRAWVEARARELHPGDDIHSRSAGLSKACFYGLMAEANRGFGAVLLGLRTEESGARRKLRAARGRYYELADGTRRVLPIADWRGVDVFAYAEANGIELLPVYKCVAMMHADEPWRIRKSWWLPGDSARFGQVAWLRRYWPSLFRQMEEWMPSAGTFT